MLPQVPIVRIADSQKMPLPMYADGIGTCMILRSSEANAIKVAPQHYETFSTGVAIALPIGMEAQIRSLKESTKNGVIVLNAPATIDASDRAEIKVCVFNAGQESVIIKRGDPIALMVFAMALRVEWQDLTQQIVDKIHLKQEQNKEQMAFEAEQKEQAETAVKTTDATGFTLNEEQKEIAQSETLSEKATENAEIEATTTSEVFEPEEESIPPSKPSLKELIEMPISDEIASTEEIPEFSVVEEIPTEEEVLPPEIISEKEALPIEEPTAPETTEPNEMLPPIEEPTAPETTEPNEMVPPIEPPMAPEMIEPNDMVPPIEPPMAPETTEPNDMVPPIEPPSIPMPEEMAPENVPELVEEMAPENEPETIVEVPRILEESPETIYPPEPTIIDEPVAPPAILEEFEKIESDYELNQKEDKT